MVWRRLARIVEYGPVEMGLSTAVGMPAGIAEFNPIEHGGSGSESLL